ncbi:MAG: hypothetical protein EP312_09290 [Gammaproteobacteria bacterium]|nr:MAG: hypothetical protein EP312_09290 [Gammaproteobacteria bacterium]
MDSKIYLSALLADAAYVDLYNDQVGDIVNSLINRDFSEAQAEFYLKNFKATHKADALSGLDAFVLTAPSGGTTVAFRGTEFNFGSSGDALSSLMDILNDGSLAVGLQFLADFFRIGQASSVDRFLKNAGLITDDGQVVAAYKGQVTFAGHSLGGHLALLAAYKYPELVKEVYTFNGAGIAPLDRLWLNHILPLVQDKPLDPAKVHNFYADKGIELTAAENGWFARPGGSTPVFIEASESASENHAIAKMVQSLAIYRVLQHLDNALLLPEGLQDIYRILDATSATASTSLETIHAQLVAWAGLESVPDAATDVEILFQALAAYDNAVAITPMAAHGASWLQAMADADTAEGRAARYAAMNAQAFSLLGGESAGAARQSATEYAPQQYSDMFWRDRSAFYTGLMQSNRSDTPSATGYVGLPGAIQFRDLRSNRVFSSASAVDGITGMQVAYNLAAGGKLLGSEGADHLYGAAGVDALYGLHGNDWLEGGDGNDTLAGGNGHDVFVGGHGKDVIELGWNHDQEGHDRYAETLWTGDELRVAGDALGALTSKAGFTGLSATDGDHQLLLKTDSGYLLLDRDNGFANSLWLPMAEGADAFFDPAQPAEQDIALLSGEPSLQWSPAYGETTLAKGRVEEGDLNEAYFFGSRLTDFATGGQLDDEIHGNSGRDWLQGGGGMDLLFGGPGSDFVYGGEGRDFLFAQSFLDYIGKDIPADRDFLDGGAGDDWLLGGNSEDILLGQGDNDHLYGNPGDDWLSGGAGVDYLWGDSRFGIYHAWVRDEAVGGEDRFRYLRPLMAMLDTSDVLQPWGDAALLSYNDVLDGGTGNDWLFGELGNDVLSGGADDDVLMGDRINRDPFFDESAFLYGFTAFGPSAINSALEGVDPVAFAELPLALHGNDVLLGGLGRDTLYGNGGDDLLQGGAGNDYLHGDDPVLESAGQGGRDRLFGEAGTDHLLGGSGDDWLDGGADDDVLRGGAGNDQLEAGAGNDTAYGDAGQDVIHGGAGMDTLYGGADADWLNGDADRDWLHGEAGNDWLAGGAGDDFLIAGDGDDWLEGGIGSDLLEGGSGADRYRFFAGDGFDVLRDEDADSVLYFEGGIQRADLEANAVNGAVFITYSVYSGDIIQLESAAAASWQLYYWDSGNQGYETMALGDLLAGRRDSQTQQQGSDYNDLASFVDVAYAGDDWHGGYGDDTVYTGNSEGQFFGDWGDDTLVGGASPVMLSGGSGNDRLVAGDDMNQLVGGSDDDVYDIGAYRPVITEDADGGYDRVVANAATDSRWILPAFTESLQLDAGGNIATLVMTPGQQDYAVTAGQVEVELVAGSGVDRLFTDAPVELLFSGDVLPDQVFVGIHNGMLSVRYADDDQLLMANSDGSMRSAQSISMRMGADQVDWLPVSPVQEMVGTDGDDRWSPFSMIWVNGLPPTVNFRDPGGEDVLISSIIHEPKAMGVDEVLRSGDDLLLRMRNLPVNEVLPDPMYSQWRIRDWFVDDAFRIEQISDNISRWSDANPIEASVSAVMESNHAPVTNGFSVTSEQQEFSLPLLELLEASSDIDGDYLVVTDVWDISRELDVQLTRSAVLNIHASEGQHQLFYRVSDGLEYASGVVDIRVGPQGSVDPVEVVVEEPAGEAALPTSNQWLENLWQAWGVPEVAGLLTTVLDDWKPFSGGNYWAQGNPGEAVFGGLRDRVQSGFGAVGLSFTSLDVAQPFSWASSSFGMGSQGLISSSPSPYQGVAYGGWLGFGG